jgi:hypothetical protein
MRLRITRGAAGAAAVTVLAAASAMSQAGPARAAVPAFEIAYAGSGGELFTYQTGTGTITDMGLPVSPGTSPGLANGQAAASYSFVPSSYRLFVAPWPAALGGDGGGGDYNLTSIPVSARTSLSMAYDPQLTLPYVVAFNFYGNGATDANELSLYADNPSNGSQSGYNTGGTTLAQGTSPAVAYDSYEGHGEALSTAVQLPDGDLAEWGGGVLAEKAISMAGGTSPAITPDNYDANFPLFAEAAHGSNGYLWVHTDNSDDYLDSFTQMAAGTSPAIASDGSAVGYDPSILNPCTDIEAAFQGVNRDLYTAVSPASVSHGLILTTADTGQRMAAGTNPAITYVGGAYQIAFHGDNGDLWLYNSGSGAATDTRIPMATGASPAIG